MVGGGAGGVGVGGGAVVIVYPCSLLFVGSCTCSVVDLFFFTTDGSYHDTQSSFSIETGSCQRILHLLRPSIDEDPESGFLFMAPLPPPLPSLLPPLAFNPFVIPPVNPSPLRTPLSPPHQDPQRHFPISHIVRPRPLLLALGVDSVAPPRSGGLPHATQAEVFGVDGALACEEEDVVEPTAEGAAGEGPDNGDLFCGGLSAGGPGEVVGQGRLESGLCVCVEGGGGEEGREVNLTQK